MYCRIELYSVGVTLLSVALLSMAVDLLSMSSRSLRFGNFTPAASHQTASAIVASRVRARLHVCLCLCLCVHLRARFRACARESMPLRSPCHLMLTPLAGNAASALRSPT